MERLFIAVNLPDEIKSEISRVQDQIKKQLKHSNVTWIAPDNFHITLHFLGDVEEWQKNELQISFKDKEYPAPFALRLQEVSAFPNKKKPKTIFLDTTLHPSMIGLRKRIADVLVVQGFKIDRRQFSSHVTLGRVKTQSEVLQPEKITIEDLDFKVESFELMSSELTPNGSIYQIIESFSLS
ncbi:MAG: RNA 2',3'-cyclic phosphodiesterase [Patescibacteria group bacterium]